MSLNTSSETEKRNKIEEIAEQWTRLILAQINYRKTNPIMGYQYQNKYGTKNNR